MQTRHFEALALALAVSGILGCDADPAPPASGSIASTGPSTWVVTSALGTPEDPIRGVGARVPTFKEDETIMLQADASGAPAEANFTAIWFGTDGGEIGRQSVRPVMGQNQLSFTAPVAGALEPGEHRVQLFANGRPVLMREFEVVSARSQ